MTNKEIIQISKSKPKKISILCTFKNVYIGPDIISKNPPARQNVISYM